MTYVSGLVVEGMEGAIKISALCAASALILAPLSDFEEVRRTKRVGERTVFPFVCMWGNSCMWVVYGLYLGDIFPTVVTNSLGLAFATYYCAVFAWALESPSQKAEAYNMFGVTILIICVLCLLCFSDLLTSPLMMLSVDGRSEIGDPVDDRARRWFGLAAGSSTVIQYASPLALLIKVIRRRSTEGLSGRLAVMSVVCGSLWLTYGSVTNDPFLYVPNTLGVAASLAQCSLFFIYPRKGRKEGKTSPSKLKRKDSMAWRSSPTPGTGVSPPPSKVRVAGVRSPKSRPRNNTVTVDSSGASRDAAV